MAGFARLDPIFLKVLTLELSAARHGIGLARACVYCPQIL
jgi:hypothetical protein